jgi:hypothetical protein
MFLFGHPERPVAESLAFSRWRLAQKSLYGNNPLKSQYMASALTAIVCSYRRPHNLAACLQSLTEQSLSDFGILVVGVRGDTQTLQAASDLGIEVILQDQPDGVAAARNLGIENTETPLIAFLDDDARARQGWAVALATVLRDPQIGAVGGRVFDTRTGEQVVHPWGVDPFGVTHLLSNADRPKTLVPTINGCNMAFSRPALRSVGGFDPYYRYYYDETDMCVRLDRAGYRIEFTDAATVDHDFADGSTRERFVYYSCRMRTYFSTKNYMRSVGKSRLVLEQVRLLRQDYHAFRVRHKEYGGMVGSWTALAELVSGRLTGFLDGANQAIQHGDNARRCSTC